MGKLKGLFLDTATQIARHWHAPSEREEIRGQLEGCKLYCSRYVKCQYKATILNSLIALYNFLLRYKDMNRALQESKRFSNRGVAGLTLTKSVQERIIDIGLWIATQYTNYSEQIRRLETFIEDSWETFFNSGLQLPLVDETSCLYANDAPKRGESGLFEPIKASCTKENPLECKIEAFWNNHRVGLESLANMKIDSIKAEPKETKELERIKEDSSKIIQGESSRGRRCTVYLSDAIICIEAGHCPEPSAVHSTNKKHFCPLGEVLGVECAC